MKHRIVDTEFNQCVQRNGPELACYTVKEIIKENVRLTIYVRK